MSYATRSSLLGSIRRRDGRRQVTYAGKPLCFYVIEGAGGRTVRCSAARPESRRLAEA